MVQPRLTDALASRKVRNLCCILLAIGLLSTLRVGSQLLHYRLLSIFRIVVQIDVAQNLRGILIRIGRFKSLEQYYTKVHLKPIKKLWEDFDLKQRSNKLASERSEVERLPISNEFQSISPAISFSSWLPSFYDELLLYLEQEWKWYASYLSMPSFSSVYIYYI